MMLGYYLELAIRSLRRNVALTALVIAAVGAGIGASMTLLTTLVAMSGNPIPDKASKLFTAQIDAWGPESRWSASWVHPIMGVTYRDAMALMKAPVGPRKTLMYQVSVTVNPLNGNPFRVPGRATYADFFSMFEVPFRSGSAWGAGEDNARDNVVVLSSRLADRVFPGVDPVGQTISLNSHTYKVLGVIRPWAPTPRFYDLADPYGESEDVYFPFLVAVDQQFQDRESTNCWEAPKEGWRNFISSDCFWLQFWVELPTAAAVSEYQTFLQGYVIEQQQLGRFHLLPRVELYDVNDWIRFYRDRTRHEERANVTIGGAFLLVCLVNAVGLLLAKLSTRAMELSVRRALGASRIDLFLQCMVETFLVGLLGGLLGLILTAAGLKGLRALRDVTDTDIAAAHLYTLDSAMVVITVLVAVVTTVCSGIYPALRASRIQPAWQLKSQ